MRRYTLNIGSREFVVDVQETDFDQFEVSVGGETYAVTLAEDQAVGGVAIAPAAAPAAAAPKKQPAGGGGKGAVKAPMPGKILEVSVKPGETVKRGQQVAILEAMKMHNSLGASQDGVIAEVCVDVGQTVAHGDVIVTFKEG